MTFYRSLATFFLTSFAIFSVHCVLTVNQRCFCVVVSSFLKKEMTGSLSNLRSKIAFLNYFERPFSVVHIKQYGLNYILDAILGGSITRI